MWKHTFLCLIILVLPRATCFIFDQVKFGVKLKKRIKLEEKMFPEDFSVGFHKLNEILFT